MNNVVYTYYNNYDIYDEIIKDKTCRMIHNKKCRYINKYGIKCNNNCLVICPLIIREYFCDSHIKNNINQIIKLNVYILKFMKYERYINHLFLTTVNVKKYNEQKLVIIDIMFTLYKLLKDNEDYLLMTQPILYKLHSLLFQCFNNHIYDILTYRTNNKLLKTFCSSRIIRNNIKQRDDSINTLKDLSINNNNTIGNVFKNSAIGEIKIFSIIESFL